MEELDPLEDLILPKLAELIEAALEMAAAEDAMERLQQISDTLRSAQAVAQAGVVLRQPF